MRFGKAVVAAVAVAAAVAVGGCEGPFMMSDEKPEKSDSIQGKGQAEGAAIKGEGSSGQK